MADDKNQKPMTTLGISMQRFGRNLMRHYGRSTSEPQKNDPQLQPYQSMSTPPLNWDNIVTPKQSNREAPLLDEPIQDDMPEQFMPPPQPRRQAPPPQQPIQRQPAPQKKKGLDPRLQAILNFHKQRDSEREIQRIERRTKWQEAHEQGDNQQPSPDIPGWKPKPRASFDYIETSALIKDKAEKPKQESIQREEADEKKPSSRSKVLEEQEFSQPAEMEEGYIAANEPSWDDVDDDFQETEHITPIDQPFADTETSKNIRMPAPKQSDRAGDTSPKPSTLQRQADTKGESDAQVLNSEPAQHTDALNENIEQSFASPTNQTPDTSQGHFERRKPNPQPPTSNQQNKTVQRKPETKPKLSPRQNEISDTDSTDNTHESDEDLSEPSQNFVEHDAENKYTQRQSTENWDIDDEYVSQSSIDKPVKNVSDKARPDAQQSPIQRQTDGDWDEDFDTQVTNTSESISNQADDDFAENKTYSEVDNTANTSGDRSRPLQRRTDKQIRRKDSKPKEQETRSNPVTSADNSRAKPANIQRQPQIDTEQDETFADGYTPSAQTTDNHPHDAPHTIQRQLEDDDAIHYSNPSPPDKPSSPIQRQADDNWQADERFSDENDYSSQVNTVENFPDSVQRRADDDWTEDFDRQVSNASEPPASHTQSQVQRQADDDFTNNETYSEIDKTANTSEDSPRPLQRQAANNWQADEHFSDENDYSQSSNQTNNPSSEQNLSGNNAYTQPVETPNPPHSIQRQKDNDRKENDTFAPPSDDSDYSSDNPTIASQHSVQRQANKHNADNNSSNEVNYSQVVDAPNENYDDPSQTIQRQPDITNEWDDDNHSRLINTSDNAKLNTAQPQADANWHDDSDFSADDSLVDASNHDTPQRPIQRRQVSQQDESPRQSRLDKPARRIQREADPFASHDDAHNSDFGEDAQNYSFPEIDNAETNAPIVQRSIGADGQMVYNVVQADDNPVARQTDPTSNLHQALIDAGIVPPDSPSPETSEQTSPEFEHSSPSNRGNVAQSPVQRTPDEHSTNAPPNKVEQVNPANSNSSEIVQRQMGADGEMYYNKAQEDQPLSEQPIDVFQGLMQAGMISPQDTPTFNTSKSSAENSSVQRTEDEALSDIGISQDIQNTMLQRLRDKNKDIMQEKAQARDTHENIQRTPEPIQPTYTASVQRTPPIDMLMREEFIEDDNSVDDVEKLTRDVYRLLSNRLRDEAERRNRK